MLCKLVSEPVIKFIQFVISVIENILELICNLIKQIINIVSQVLQYICNTIVQTICGAVCNVICGICSFFCWIFGCDCHCDTFCQSVCNVVTTVLCGWTWIIKNILQAIVVLICDYIIKAIIALLNLIEMVVTAILEWICVLGDDLGRLILCGTRIADLRDSTDPRVLQVAPKIVPNDQGYSDWFVYVNNPTANGVDQTQRGYILSDQGRPLTAQVDPGSGAISYYEVETDGDIITGTLKQDAGNYVPGQPFLYYAYKVLEIASHLLGDIFATSPGDNGQGADFHQNLYTYNPNVQNLLAQQSQLKANNYNAWPGKNSQTNAPNDRTPFFGDGSISDMGTRVDTDATCSRPTNTFLELVNGQIEFTPGNTEVAENMTCDFWETLHIDDTNFMMQNKDGDANAITNYLVSRYNPDDSQVGCNQFLGYTVVTFDGQKTPLFILQKVLPFVADTNTMMASIVGNISGKGDDVQAGMFDISVVGHNADIVRVAETFVHETGHQCGLTHVSGNPDCWNSATLNIAKVMDPDGTNRRSYSRWSWCMIRTSPYVTSDNMTPFTQAAELPDSGTGGTKPIG